MLLGDAEEARTVLQEALVAAHGEKGRIDDRSTASLNAELRWRRLSERFSRLLPKRRAKAKRARSGSISELTEPKTSLATQQMADNMKAYEALSRAYLLLKEPVRAHFCARMSRRLASRLGDEGGVSQADVLLASMGKQVTYRRKSRFSVRLSMFHGPDDHSTKKLAISRLNSTTSTADELSTSFPAKHRNSREAEKTSERA